MKQAQQNIRYAFSVDFHCITFYQGLAGVPTSLGRVGRITGQNRDLEHPRQLVSQRPYGALWICGTLTQGCAALHPGLFSFSPYGRIDRKMFVVSHPCRDFSSKSASRMGHTYVSGRLQGGPFASRTYCFQSRKFQLTLTAIFPERDNFHSPV
jgi:hypothetical protein